jgi:glycine/D-amino acid oxidase-like deaminating enzyme
VSPDVVIVGAGMVGASCAYALSRAGLKVTVIDRKGVAAGTTGAGEGNILVSDKEPGPELDLALWSNRLWREWGAEVGGIELEPKGGLVVGSSDELPGAQASAGVIAEQVDPRSLEPRLAPHLTRGVFYPQDMQVQPMLAAARLLRASGATVLPGTELTGVHVASGRITSIDSTTGSISTRHVINAAGTWGGPVSSLLGAPVPVLPRRGFILVTEPLPPGVIRHKVYTADYVANVASSDEGLETSTVVEGTASGTVLIGASRERVGFDPSLSVPVLRRLADGAVRLFPFLRDVRLLRAYRGFRPYCPDHLPVIGPDPRVDGVLHACGHEGAGIGLAPATGVLIASMLTGVSIPVPATPFSPERFAS